MEKNKAFAEKYSFNYPLLCDVDRKVGMAYGACDDPKAATASRVAFLIGADGKIEKNYGKVSAGKFPDEALSSCA